LGWTGPKKIHGTILEGSFSSHQVPLPAAKTDKEDLAALQAWLSSYKPDELFTETGDVIQGIKALLPESSKRLGLRKEAYQGFVKPKLVDWKKYTVDKGGEASSMTTIAKFLDQVLVDNPHSVRIFSPDELMSNKFNAIFEHTGRNFQWDQFSNARGGRAIELLSEHVCQGFLQGYTLTGRVGILPSYESFLGIIHTMMVQYSKFNKIVSPSPRVALVVAHCSIREEILHGTGILLASTILKRVHGLDKSIMDSLTRIRRSSGLY
jgi:xylulose-5-phosphate/fructose-6-phosphate phosphoketolase